MNMILDIKPIYRISCDIKLVYMSERGYMKLGSNYQEPNFP